MNSDGTLYYFTMILLVRGHIILVVSGYNQNHTNWSTRGERNVLPPQQFLSETKETDGKNLTPPPFGSIYHRGAVLDLVSVKKTIINENLDSWTGNPGKT